MAVRLGRSISAVRQRNPVVERDAAVDGDRGAGDVAGEAVRQERQRHVGHVLGPAEAPQRDLAVESKAAALKPPPGTAPGASALTRMPAGPSARASSFTTMVCPALEAA